MEVTTRTSYAGNMTEAPKCSDLTLEEIDYLSEDDPAVQAAKLMR